MALIPAPPVKNYLYSDSGKSLASSDISVESSSMLVRRSLYSARLPFDNIVYELE